LEEIIARSRIQQAGAAIYLIAFAKPQIAVHQIFLPRT
jgi:hypothetical protein